MITTEEKVNLRQEDLLTDYRFFNHCQQAEAVDVYNFDDLLDNMQLIDNMSIEDYIVSIPQF